MGKRDLSVVRGTTKKLRLTIRDRDLVDAALNPEGRVDLTGATFQLEIKADVADAEPVVRKTTTSGIEILPQVGDELGQALVTLDPADTRDLAPATYVYDVVMTKSGVRSNVVPRSSLIVERGVTELESGAPVPETPLLSLDLATATVPADILCTRTGGTVYAARGSSSAVAVGDNAPIYEDRGGPEGGGVWAFPSYANALPTPFAHGAEDGWTYGGTPAVVHAANAGTAPDGTMTADRLEDANAATFAAVHRAAPMGPVVHSAWIRDSAPQPESEGSLTSDTSATAGVGLGMGGSWRRISHRRASGGGSHVYWPAGVRPGTVSHPPVGAILVWGSQAVAGKVDYPLVDGTAGDCSIRLSAAALGKILSSGGELDLEGSLLPAHPETADLGTTGLYWLFSAQTPDGDLGLYWDPANTRYGLRVRGVDVILTSASAPGPTGQMWREGDLLTWRVWYRPTTGGDRSAGIRLAVNGVSGKDAVGTASGQPLGTPTSLYLGSSYTPALWFPGRHVSLVSRSVPTGLDEDIDADGVLLGDSITAPRLTAIAALVATSSPAYARAGRRFASLATGGDTAAGQLAKWQASKWRGDSGVEWVAIQVGINDITTLTGPQIIAAIQAIVDDVATHNPAAKILVGKLTPAKSYFANATHYARWREVNDAIAGVGATPITGVHARVTSHEAALNDGVGNLLAAYSVGDGLHPNNAGRAVIGQAYRTALQGLGLLP